jgi:hypothetical protein
MIVPASPKYISGIDALSVGHNYSISSGVGGGFPLEYLGPIGINGMHRFKNLAKTDGWAEAYPFFDIPADKLTQTIYINVPTDRWAADRQAAWKKARGVHAEHEANCKACKRSNVLHIEFIGPEGDTATVLFAPDNNRWATGFYISANSAPPDHPRRVELPALAKQINEWAGIDLHWNIMDDEKRYWSPCVANGHDMAYRLIIRHGFAAHGEEQTWVDTGKWPD